MTFVTKNEMLTLIGEYWDLAYAEGRVLRTHDTPESDAQKKLMQIKKALNDLYGRLGATTSVVAPDECTCDDMSFGSYCVKHHAWNV